LKFGVYGVGHKFKLVKSGFATAAEHASLAINFERAGVGNIARYRPPGTSSLQVPPEGEEGLDEGGCATSSPTFVSQAPRPLITIPPSVLHSSAPKNGGTTHWFQEKASKQNKKILLEGTSRRNLE